MGSKHNIAYHRKKLRSLGWDICEKDFDQAVSFLHNNGILLNYDDNSSLRDLYFIDPKWLCEKLAIIIADNNVNRDIDHGKFVKCCSFSLSPILSVVAGFMWTAKMRKKISHCEDEIINLMRKFEIIHLLDEKRVLIPSFLPPIENNACIIHYNALTDPSNDLFLSVQKDDKIITGGFQIFCRYFLLPFVPNGFFGRLIARLINSDILKHLCSSLATNPLEALDDSYKMHWRCWREGISIVWKERVILRIAKITDSLSDVILISEGSKDQLLKLPQGLDIKVAMIPEQDIIECRFLKPTVRRLSEQQNFQHANTLSIGTCKGRCTASWLLHQATSVINSVFTDWYEGFADVKNFKDELLHTLRMANYCSQCIAFSDELSKVYLYTSKFCCLTAYREEQLLCPNHGNLKVEDVAPDLVRLQF